MADRSGQQCRGAGSVTIPAMLVNRRRWARTAATLTLLTAVSCYALYRRIGIPFVQPREHWSIGIVEGRSAFDFDLPGKRSNPVFTAADVTDVPAKFVADPFLVRDGAAWYLFFEVYNRATRQGDLAVATSTDTRSWQYEGLVIDEPFHLSYPYVFRAGNDWYLIPESYEARSVRLYRAREFPRRWEFVRKLIDGRELVDNSIAYFNGYWWLFSCETSNDTLHLFFSSALDGAWQEHAASPIVVGNPHKARPAGRVLVHDGRLFRYTMDVEPTVGSHQVFAYEITEITPTSYAERLVREQPVLAAAGVGWNGDGMHQIDPVQVGPDHWIASADGFGRYPLVFWRN
jgi:hypothetical protein